MNTQEQLSKLFFLIKKEIHQTDEELLKSNNDQEDILELGLLILVAATGFNDIWTSPSNFASSHFASSSLKKKRSKQIPGLNKCCLLHTILDISKILFASDPVDINAFSDPLDKQIYTILLNNLSAESCLFLSCAIQKMSDQLAQFLCVCLKYDQSSYFDYDSLKELPFLKSDYSVGPYISIEDLLRIFWTESKQSFSNSGFSSLEKQSQINQICDRISLLLSNPDDSFNNSNNEISKINKLLQIDKSSNFVRVLAQDFGLQPQWIANRFKRILKSSPFSFHQRDIPTQELDQF